ncbi:RICIN domain-containing protein [Aquimarina aggregata]|uniref:RICIN domain-containing protein n=1 Tax=Aquimarina aggregata TaxID=1642818 RepID=UPI00082D61B3|nr:RICIN domain-containing protein [Aquimarina aggregata]
MIQLRTLVILLLLVMLRTPLFSQTVTIDYKTQKFLGNISQLDRTKYFTLHDNSNDTDSKKFYADFNVSPGRGFWGPFSHANSKTGSVGNYPNFINSNNTSVRNVTRYVGTEHPRNVVRYNLNKEKGAAWAAEYYKNHVDDSGRPEFFEPMNEPFVHAGDDVFKPQQPDNKKMKYRMAEWFGAIGKKFDETPELAKIKVIGYSSAWPSLELWDFRHWNENMKMFMDVAGNHMDAFAVHLYDGVNVTGQDNKRSGSNSEAILDLIETYSYTKWGRVKPHAITEYGGIEKGYGPNYSDIKSAISLKSINGILFNLLDREDRMAISIPFITGKARWHITGANNYQPYTPSLWRPLSVTPTSNPNKPILKNWKYTAKIDFYRLWSEVKGKRVLVKSDNPDIQIQGFVNGKKLYVALNNLDDKTQKATLNMTSNLAGLQKVRIKSLKIFDNANPKYSDTERTTAPANITLIAGETVVLEYTFANTISSTNTIRTVNYYSKKHLQTINANSEISFSFNGVKTGTGYANLKMSIGRKHDKSKSPIVKVNGTRVSVPANWKGYDQRNRNDFFGTIDIPVAMNLLKGNTTVTVQFPDGGGRISSVILGVNKYDNDVVEENKDTISFSNINSVLQVADSYTVDVDYEAAKNREIQVGFWSSTGWIASSAVQTVSAGKGTKSITVQLPKPTEPGTGYVFKAHIRPVGGTWQEALKWAQVNSITIEAVPQFKDEVSFKDPKTTIISADSYNFDIGYEASTNRELVVEFWSSLGWVAQQKEVVTAGKGVKSITVKLPSKPAPGTGYVYKTHIRPIGTTWREALQWDTVNGITVIAENTQLIANGTYYISSSENSQRLLSRALEKHSAVMRNPGNFEDQKWIFEHKGDDVYTIKNKGTNRYLEVPFGSCVNGANVATWTDATDAHKQWKAVSNGNGIFGLKPMHCIQKSLDRAAGATNANAQLWDYNSGNRNQKWKIVPADNTLSKSAVTREVASFDAKKLIIAPNPVKEALVLYNLNTFSDIRILDLRGQEVMSKRIKEKNDENIIDVSGLESGVYFIVINNGPAVKILKE